MQIHKQIFSTFLAFQFLFSVSAQSGEIDWSSKTKIVGYTTTSVSLGVISAIGTFASGGNIWYAYGALRNTLLGSASGAVVGLFIPVAGLATVAIDVSVEVLSDEEMKEATVAEYRAIIRDFTRNSKALTSQISMEIASSFVCEECPSEEAKNILIANYLSDIDSIAKSFSVNLINEEEITQRIQETTPAQFDPLSAVLMGHAMFSAGVVRYSN